MSEAPIQTTLSGECSSSNGATLAVAATNIPSVSGAARRKNHIDGRRRCRSSICIAITSASTRSTRPVPYLERPVRRGSCVTSISLTRAPCSAHTAVTRR